MQRTGGLLSLHGGGKGDKEAALRLAVAALVLGHLGEGPVLREEPMHVRLRKVARQVGDVCEQKRKHVVVS